jgi:3-oxoacyl-[acyl-carrier-protein] synthase III
MTPALEVNARRGLPHSSLLAAASFAYPSDLVSNEAYAARCRFGPTSTFAELAEQSRMVTRRWCLPHENTRTLAQKAVRELMQREPELCSEIDAVVVASGTTMPMAHPADPENPAMADLSPFVLEALGGPRALGLDIKACYCSGFLRGVQVVDALLGNEGYRSILLVAAEQGSRFAVAESNRSSFCFIVGDAAGAVLFRRTPREEGSGVIDYVGHTEVDKRAWVGIGRDAASITMLGSQAAAATKALLVECATRLLERNRLDQDAVTWLLPIQTHGGLLDEVTRALRWPDDRVLWFGNVNGFSGSASIPSCLAEQAALGRVKRGDLILSVAVGAGLNCAGALYRY